MGQALIWDGLLAALGFLAGAIALFSLSLRGSALSALALGLGVGAITSLAVGAEGFICLAAVGAGSAIVLLLGERFRAAELARALVGSSAVAPKPRVFGDRSVRAILGAVGLFTARLLSGHLTAGTIATQGPGFACLFVFEVGLIRIGTGRGPADLALGALCSGMGAGGFLLLSAPGSTLAVALLLVGSPALAAVALARAAPWESSA